MEKKRRRTLIRTAAIIILLMQLTSGRKRALKYEILEDDAALAFARYSKGLIYIGNKTLLESIEAHENDVLVLDQRNAKDPNMRIIDSYKIGDDRAKSEILQVLLEYENKNPSNWDRTYESMAEEWGEHDTLYRLNYQTHRTADVDLNNADEKKYRRFYRLFKEGIKDDRN